MTRKRRGLVMPDLHAPLHSEKALREMLAFARDYKPDIFVSLGDTADCETLSDFDHPLDRTRFFAEEVKGAAGVLDRIAASVPRATKFICLGNHEVRLTRFIQRRAPELYGMVSIDDSLGLKRNGFRITPYGEMLKIGKMHFAHDLGKSGIGAARHATGVVQGNVIIGHTHRLEVVYERNAKGETHMGCTLGWLGDPRQITYRPKPVVAREWVHAFGSFELEASGVVRFQAHPIF